MDFRISQPSRTLVIFTFKDIRQEAVMHRLTFMAATFQCESAALPPKMPAGLLLEQMWAVASTNTDVVTYKWSQTNKKKRVSVNKNMIQSFWEQVGL